MTTQNDYAWLADKLAPYLLRYLRTNTASAASAPSGLIPHDWNGPAHTGVPDTFPPEAHTHPGTDITSKVGAAAAADTVPWTGVGSPPVSLQYMDAIVSGSRLWGGAITSNGDGTVAIAAGGGLSKVDEAGPEDGPATAFTGQASRPIYVTWDAVASLALADEAYNYIYYDGSTEEIKATTDFYSISFTQDFTVGRVYRTGTSVVIRLCGTNAWNFNRRIQLYHEEVNPIVRARGFAVGSTGTRNLTITAGILWAEGTNRFSVGWGIDGLSAFNSATGNSWTYWYRNGSNGWTSSASATQIDNQNWDDSNGTLGTLTANRYGVHWVYVVHDASVHIVYGQGNYTLAQAEISTPPASLPGVIGAYATLIARVIVQKSSDTLTIESAFETTFVSSGVTNHGDLAGLGNDDHTQYILKATWGEHGIVKADTAGAPANMTVPPSTLVGRGPTGGIAALSAGDARTVLGLATTDAPTFAGVVAGYVAPASDGTAAFQVRKADKSTAVVTVDTTNSRFGLGTVSPTISDGIGMDINGKILRLRTSKTPASASATGNVGEICWDANYFYICTATNTWRRVAHASW